MCLIKCIWCIFIKINTSKCRFGIFILKCWKKIYFCMSYVKSLVSKTDVRRLNRRICVGVGVTFYAHIYTCSSSWSAASCREVTLGSHLCKSFNKSENLACLASKTALSTVRSTGSASLIDDVVVSNHSWSSRIVWWNSPF